MAHDTSNTPDQEHTTQRVSRRAFLRRVALGLTLPTVGGAVAACQSPWSTKTTTLDPVHFGVIGDFGLAGKGAQDVAALVKSWNPHFIVTVGDNNYEAGAAKTIDTNIGQYYADYIGNYHGTYGAGADANRFWPVLGNHDWLSDNARPYFDYFTLPDEKYYYTFTQGPVQFFMLDSNKQTPDGGDKDSKQGQWLRQRLAESVAPWRVVLFHHTPFSSGTNGATPRMRWPFAEWGASLVLAGHDHVYERFNVNGMTYITNGLGGAERYEETKLAKDSEIFFNDSFGAMLIDADVQRMALQFITPTNKVIDHIELTAKKA